MNDSPRRVRTADVPIPTVRLSHDALEALAATLPAKVADLVRVQQNQTDNWLEFEQSDKAFKDRVQRDLALIRQSRLMFPAIAAAFAAVAVGIATLAIQIASSSAAELREFKMHVRSSAP